jgi:hypothetical protein
MNSKGVVTVLACVGGMGLLTGSILASDSAGVFAKHSTTVAAGAITAPVKLCSAVNDPHWRDTITPPDTWSAATCAQYAVSVGAIHTQLGCADSNGFHWGNYFNSTGMTPNAPDPNSCKWQ